MNTGKERRKFRRMSYGGIGILYVVKSHAAEETKSAIVKSHNVSGGGILLTGMQPFASGTILGMTLSTAFHEGRDRLFGKVIRSQEIKPGYFETAIEFILLGPPDYEAVARVLGS